MDEKEKLYAKKIVNGLAEENLSFGEAMGVIKKSYGILEKTSYMLNQKRRKTALKEVLKAAEDYSSSIGESPRD